MAERVGIQPILTANDIVSGDEKLNMAFLAELFNRHNGLNRNSIAQEVLEELDVDNLEELDGVFEEETREEETFKNWVNSLGIAPISKLMPGFYVLFQKNIEIISVKSQANFLIKSNPKILKSKFY